MTHDENGIKIESKDRGGTPFITESVADIDRERELMVALIHVAGNIATCEEGGPRPDVYAAANDFLIGWFGRKRPSLDLPKLQ